MRIHDHFYGSANCVECHGICRLEGDELQATRLIRFVLEFFAQYRNGWLPPFVEDALSKLLPDRKLAEFRYRARIAISNSLRDQ